MKGKIPAWLSENIALKLIALAIACMIWLFVRNSDDPIETELFSSVEITIVNEDSIADIGKVVEPQGSGTVTLKVKERRSVLKRLSKSGSDFYVEADLENINEMDSVPLTVTCSNTSVTWDEIEISPASLKVTLEDKVEQAFPVSVSVSGQPISGLEVGATSVVEGKNILIAGPSSLVNIIGTVQAPIVVSATASDTTLTSQLRVMDKNGSTLTDSQMSRLEFKDSNGILLQDRTVFVDVDLWRVMQEVWVLVDTEGDPADGYVVSQITTIPRTLSLAGTEEALEEVRRGLQIINPISVEGATETISEEIDLTATLAEIGDIRLVDADEPIISVEITIEKSGDMTYSIPLGNVEVKNKPSDVKLVFTPADVIPVSVHSDTEDVAQMDPESIHAVMDLASCSEEGTYEIPVEITLPEGYELNSVVTITVNVTALKQEPSSEDEENTGGAVITAPKNETETETETRKS